MERRGWMLQSLLASIPASLYSLLLDLLLLLLHWRRSKSLLRFVRCSRSTHAPAPHLLLDVVRRLVDFLLAVGSQRKE